MTDTVRRRPVEALRPAPSTVGIGRVARVRIVGLTAASVGGWAFGVALCIIAHALGLS